MRLILCITLVILLFPSAIYADFYSWIDDAGITHFSTHPRQCVADGYFDPMKPGCSPLPLSSNEIVQRERARRADEIATANAKRNAECAALETALTTAIRKLSETQQSVRDQLSRAATDSHTAPSIKTLIALPATLAELQERALSADKDYDRCFPEAEVVLRKRSRNEFRRQLVENARDAERQSTLRQIQIDIHQIKNDM